MTAQEQLALKAVVLHEESFDSAAVPAFRLLSDLGHEVKPTSSADQAIELLQEDSADLLVVDSDRTGHEDLVSRLSALPAHRQPRSVAIFSESMDDSLASQIRSITRAKVHVLLRPLHMHGLLRVLRNMDARTP